MKPKLDMDRIGKALGAERVGRVSAGSGHFAALQLVAEVKARFRTPDRGGRATDRDWTEAGTRRVPAAPGSRQGDDDGDGLLEPSPSVRTKARGIACSPPLLDTLPEDDQVGSEFLAVTAMMIERHRQMFPRLHRAT